MIHLSIFTSMTAPVASGSERLPGGPCTHWKAPPFHGARQQPTYAVQQKASSLDHLVGAGEHALAAELGKDGVRVNAIGPGLIETPLNEKVRASNPELVKTFIDHTPLGRTGKPEDIVGPAIFLASDLSAYVTGSIIMADGGYRSI